MQRNMGLYTDILRTIRDSKAEYVSAGYIQGTVNCRDSLVLDAHMRLLLDSRMVSGNADPPPGWFRLTDAGHDFLDEKDTPDDPTHQVEYYNSEGRHMGTLCSGVFTPSPIQQEKGQDDDDKK